MFKNQFKYLFIIVSLVALTACSSLPTAINLAPELNLDEQSYQFNQSEIWKVNSQDLRVARHLIEIVDGDNVAQLINEQQSIRLLIENSLKQAWITNGLSIADQSEYEIDIQLIKALTTVTEPTMSYEVETQMMLQVQLTHKNKKFAKLFRSNHQWEAPFSTSISRITEEINTQLTELLMQVVKDEEINAKLQSFK